MNETQLTGIYVVYLGLFGVGLVLFALWVFCLLSGPEFGTCTLGI